MSRRRTRRRVLATLGAVGGAAVAGCTGPGGDGDAANGQRTTATIAGQRGPGQLSFGQGFSENGVRARPTDPAVQQSVHHETSDGAYGAYRGEDERYLFVTVSTGSMHGIDLPEPGDFRVVAGDRTIAGRTTLEDPAAGDPRPDDRGPPYDLDRKENVERLEGWLLFPMPTAAPAGDAELVLQPTEAGRPWAVWPLPDPVRDRLASPVVPLAVESVSVPDRVPAGESIPVSVRVENAGESAAPFRFGVSVGGEGVEWGRLSVPAGQVATWEADLDPPAGEGTVPVAVRTPGETLERTVEVGSNGGTDG